jgi:hypothetical protein
MPRSKQWAVSEQDTALSSSTSWQWELPAFCSSIEVSPPY